MSPYYTPWPELSALRMRDILLHVVQYTCFNDLVESELRQSVPSGKRQSRKPSLHFLHRCSQFSQLLVVTVLYMSSKAANCSSLQDSVLLLSQTNGSSQFVSRHVVWALCPSVCRQGPDILSTDLKTDNTWCGMHVTNVQSKNYHSSESSVAVVTQGSLTVFPSGKFLLELCFTGLVPRRDACTLLHPVYHQLFCVFTHVCSSAAAFWLVMLLCRASTAV